MRIIFSILHYQTLETTIECIESLLNLNNYKNEVYIIVVDNGSPNKSGLKLKNIYREKKSITVIECERNLGFARGNNIGYQYAKKYLNPDIIIAINNDIIVNQLDFINILVELVNENKDISIFAPDIINKKNEHQNPIRTQRVTISQILWVHFYNIFMYIAMHIPIINETIIRYLHHVHKKRQLTLNDSLELYFNTNIVPHGAAIIFANNFLRHEEKAFNPNTFLYAEEDLLYEYILKKNYKTIYTNKLIIHHLEDVSTDSLTINEVKKRIFVSKHKIHSTRILLKERIKNL